MSSLLMNSAISLLKGRVWKVPGCGGHKIFVSFLEPPKRGPGPQQCPGEVHLETRLWAGGPKSFLLWAEMY